MTNAERREMYQCDITFGTANEFGFDYLRDNMAQTAEDRVHRNYNYAIIDEVDSILIDEARTPLIISGQVESSVHDRYREMKPTVERIVHKQTALINEMVSKAEKLLETESKDTEFEAGINLLAARRGSPKNKRLPQTAEGDRRQPPRHRRSSRPSCAIRNCTRSTTACTSTSTSANTPLP